MGTCMKQFVPCDEFNYQLNMFLLLINVNTQMRKRNCLFKKKKKLAEERIHMLKNLGQPSAQSS